MSDVFPLTDHTALLRAFGNPAGAGDNTIISAVPGRKIKVLAGFVLNNAATANTVFFKSGANTIGPNMVLPASLFGMAPFPYNEGGWLLCNAGEALILNLSAATAIGISVLYTLL